MYTKRITSMLILSTLSSFKPPSFLCSFIVINPANLPDMGYITPLTITKVYQFISLQQCEEAEADRGHDPDLQLGEAGAGHQVGDRGQEVDLHNT